MGIFKNLGFHEITTERFREINKLEGGTLGKRLVYALNQKDPKVTRGLYHFSKELTEILIRHEKITKDTPIVIRHPLAENRFPDFLLLEGEVVVYLEIKTHWGYPDYGKNPHKHFAVYLEIDFRQEKNAYAFGKNLLGYLDQWELEGIQKRHEDKIKKIHKSFNGK